MSILYFASTLSSMSQKARLSSSGDSTWGAYAEAMMNSLPISTALITRRRTSLKRTLTLVGSMVACLVPHVIGSTVLSQTSQPRFFLPSPDAKHV